MYMTCIIVVTVINIVLVCSSFVKQTNSSLIRSTNCTSPQTECGDGFCCCSSKGKPGSMQCSSIGRELTYIPRPPYCLSKFCFTGNNLPEISETSLLNLTTFCVRTLRLDNNAIVNITPGAFSELRCLKSLDLSNNIGLNHGQLRMALASASKLKFLRLADIGLRTISERLFESFDKSKIEEMDFSGNNLQTSFMLNVSIFAAFPRILKLVFRSCEAGKVIVTLKVPVMKLDLRGNRIGPESPIFCIEGDSMLPNIISINLDSNQIEFISDDTISCLRTLQKLDLSDNRIMVLKGNSFWSLPSLRTLYLNDMNVRPIIRPFAFNNSRLETLSLSMNEITFSNENIQDIFGGMENLRTLDISRNNFFKVEDRAFVQMLSPMKQLQSLKMDRIRLTCIPGFLRILKHVSFLSLNGNSIQSLNGSLKYAKRLQCLYLSGNSIGVIKKTDFPDTLLKTLREIELGENPFSCTCELLWFRTWIDTTMRNNKTRVLGFPKQYRCKTPKPMMLVDFHPTKQACANHGYAIYVYILFVFVILLFITSIPLVYKKRWYLSYWYYKLRRVKTLNAERRALLDNAEDLLHDAYVIYQDDDRDFVHNDLIDLLEKRHGLRLHIWHRDQEKDASLPVMFDAIYASRRAIAIFSDNFLKDDYCRFEFYVALDRAKNIHDGKVVVVLLDNLEIENLTKYWCMIMTKMPTAKWSDDVGDNGRDVFEDKIIRIFNKF